MHQIISRSTQRYNAVLAQQELEAERQRLPEASELEQQQQVRDFVGYFLHELGGLAAGAKGILAVLQSARTSKLAASWCDDQRSELVPGVAEDLLPALNETMSEIHLLLEDLTILLRQGHLPAMQCQRIEVSRLFEQVARLAMPAQPAIDLVIEASPPDLVVYGDPVLLRRALLTAIRNAEQALLDRPTHQRPRIILRGAQEDGWVCLCVEDSGPGFPPQILNSLRALVLRPEGTLPIGWLTDKAGGSGRGLPLLDQVARLHQGSLGLGNLLGSPGAWVQLRLPSRGC